MLDHVQDDRRVVVVGSGPAGAAAAVVLAEAGIDVVVLDVGKAEDARGLTSRLAGYTFVKVSKPLTVRTDGVHFSGDPKTLLYEELSPGGLTNHWSCAVPRFSPEDFRDAQRAGEAYTWPIGYQDLAPWYDRMEPLLHISGAGTDAPLLPGGKVVHVSHLGRAWSPVAEQARKNGRGFLPAPYAYGGSTTLTLSGTVFNAFVRLLRPLQRAGRVAIRFGARVHQLEWSGRARRVEAVIYRDTATGEDHRLPCRAVVVAAGAVNTTKLLLGSTSADFPDGLGNTHGVLGRYLHDHPLGKIELELAAPVPMRPPAYLTRAPLEGATPLYAAAGMQWSSMALLTRSMLSAHPGHLRRCGFNIFGTMAPVVDNFVALDRSRTCADGSPGIELHIRHPPASRDLLVGARDQLLELLDRAGLQPKVRDWFFEPVGESKHFGGTCRIHASPKYGMLDAWSRMHAVGNVIVADSAALTTGPEKNPVLTAMALAGRASHRLAEDLKSGKI
jgi:choline dehydrogenase-like flavoprotein